MTNRILLIIDVQQGFINDATAHIPAMVTALQAHYEMVRATRFINPPGSPHRLWTGWQRFAPGSRDADLAFAPDPETEIHDKTIYSAAPPSVCAAWAAQDIDEVHLCGIATDNCVLKTAVDLFEARLRPVVLAAACASHGGQAAHECGLMLLRRFIGTDQIQQTLPG